MNLSVRRAAQGQGEEEEGTSRGINHHRTGSREAREGGRESNLNRDHIASEERARGTPCEQKSLGCAERSWDLSVSALVIGPWPTDASTLDFQS